MQHPRFLVFKHRHNLQFKLAILRSPDLSDTPQADHSEEGGKNRRGVVFIAEIVPKHAVAMVAHLIYGENYVCLPRKHHVATDGSKKTVKYQWRVKNQWCQLTATTSSLCHPCAF
jgi:Uncharacterized conserved protein (COG2071)